MNQTPDPGFENASFPLSHGQRRLWFLDQLIPNSSLYSLPLALRVSGPLDCSCLHRCILQIVQRHESLRTIFVQRQDEPEQVILPVLSPRWLLVDLSALPPSQQQEQTAHLLQQQIARPFDLQRGPLLRLLLLRQQSQEHVLLLSMQHIIADGWSLGILFDELVRLYEAGVQQQASPLEELAVQYAEVVQWQRTWLETEVMQQQLDYWTRQLAQGEPVALPLDHPRPATASWRGASWMLEVSAEVTRGLRRVGQQEKATLFMTLMAAFQLLLSRYSGQQDISVGTPIANRPHPAMEPLIGFFTNTVVLRTRLDDNPSYRQLLRRVRQIALDAYTYPDLPFEVLVQEVRPERAFDRHPLFQVMFSLDRPLSLRRIGETTFQPLFLPSMTAKFDLTVEILERGQGLTITVEYNRDLFEQVTIERLIHAYHCLLQAIVIDPDQQIAFLPCVPDTDFQRIQQQGKRNDYGVRPLPTLFEMQAERTPDRIAISYKEQFLTYKELNERANQLARYLQRCGVEPGVLVGISVERSPAMLIGLLGILKAGGAYLPLDPTYPEERLTFMVKDARARVMLTQHRLRSLWAEHIEQLILLDMDWEEIAGERRENVMDTVWPAQLAYVMYTSGSTGKPKGIMIPHSSLANYLSWSAQHYRVASGQGALVHSSLSFDLTITTLFAPLLVGQRVILLPEEQGLVALVDALSEEADLSLVKITPSHLDLFQRLLPIQSIMSRIGTLILGGERLLGEQLLPWRKHAPGTRLVNEYGPTESTVGCCVYEIPPDVPLAGPISIGEPIDNTALFILDDNLQLAPLGGVGELCIAGDGLAYGYYGRPDLTAERFFPNPFSTEPGMRLYRSGDRARYRPDGTIEYLGRRDQQVKVRGFRIELSEIEAVLNDSPLVQEAVVGVNEQDPGNLQILAFVIPTRNLETADELMGFVRKRLPGYMLPTAIISVHTFPLTNNGKVDRKKLVDAYLVREETRKEPERRSMTEGAYASIEDTILAIWQDVLKREDLDSHANFFDVGGHSLLLVQVHHKLQQAFQTDIALLDLFKYPSVSSLARFLAPAAVRPQAAAPFQLAHEHRSSADEGIAIIGMAGRFPGAQTLAQFWQNLCDGAESISFFSEEELAAAGVDENMRRDPHYVSAGGALKDIEYFDASFFGYSPREAEVIDPQQRLFLECAWQACEDAGYAPDSYKGRIGVYAGQSLSTYLLRNLSQRFQSEDTEAFFLSIQNDKDFLATRVTYKLNLRGPAITVQTACSTSLVAVHLACQSLYNHECDMVLAGGVAVRVPETAGYRYQEGNIASPDGHCRAFDAHAQGTVGGNGVGVVLLKRLSEARADKDHILAVIRGSAINNDGSDKVGYTAPSIQGQAEVIAGALTRAGVSPETLSYVEAHGTGTPLGDPIEVAALTQVFRASTARTGFCALGSVKTNIGHLDAAAGIAGLIKTVLMLQHHMLPPSLHFQTPNPQIDFAHSPFHVNTRLVAWERMDHPRRAGVSSFGVGGTNAHVILEEAPEQKSEAAAADIASWFMFPVSARTSSSLSTSASQLIHHLQSTPEQALADVAYTLQVGRKAFPQRLLVVGKDRQELIAGLDQEDLRRRFVGTQKDPAHAVAFVFPGQGSQYLGMGQGLYQQAEIFREVVDECARLFQPLLAIDLRTLLYPPDGQQESSEQALNQTRLTQPALFTIEYALACQWLAWGVEPAAMLGHSIGEYVAACLAGVFTLEDALKLVALRGRLMQEMPEGAMLMVPLAEQEVVSRLSNELSLAAVNGPTLCVVAGPALSIESFGRQLAREGVSCRRLRTSHAFHSTLMEPMMAPFAQYVAQVPLHAPQIPYLSNVSGSWITSEQALDPDYWAEHLRSPVRFSQAVEVLLRARGQAIIEVGPNAGLSTLVRQAKGFGAPHIVLSSVNTDRKPATEYSSLLSALGQLWVEGQPVNWQAVQPPAYKVSLPSYPFERQRYWIDASSKQASVVGKRPIDEWFYQASWKRVMLLRDHDEASGARTTQTWLLLSDGGTLAQTLHTRLTQLGQQVVLVEHGDSFIIRDSSALCYQVRVTHPEDYMALLQRLQEQGIYPQVVVHLWLLASPAASTCRGEQRLAYAEQMQTLGFASLFHLVKAYGTLEHNEPVRIWVISRGMHAVNGDDLDCPEKASVLGLCRVIPKEYHYIDCCNIDIAPDPASSLQEQLHVQQILNEMDEAPGESIVAYRGTTRWIPYFEALSLPIHQFPGKRVVRLREKGIYLITGGLGGIGLTLASYLAKHAHARLILLSRNVLPPRPQWRGWLQTHDAKNKVSECIHVLQQVEELGGEVVVWQADVCDYRRMQEVVQDIRTVFGGLNGVIHAAGIAGEGAIQRKDYSTAQAVLAPKVTGTLILAELLADFPLDFLLLCSSLEAQLGNFGQADYCGANAFLDAFAQSSAKRNPSTWVLSINWGAWQEVGMAARAASREEQYESLRQRAMTPLEGAVAWECLLGISKHINQVLVSPHALSHVIEQASKERLLRESDQKATVQHERPALTTPYVAPRNSIERTLVEILQELLGIQHIGVEDNFFELGGDSLLAIQLSSRIRSALNVDLPLRDLFKEMLVSKLAEVIASRRTAEARPQNGQKIMPAQSHQYAPLSFAQQRLWFLDQLNPGNPAYVIPQFLRLQGPLNIAVIERCFSEILRRHEVLRTTFALVDEQLVQVIQSATPFSLVVIDLRSLDRAQQGERVRHLGAEQIHFPFDLTKDLMLRATLLQLEDQAYVLLLTMHHIACDAWSMSLFFHELKELYEAFLTNQPSPLAELPIQYADFAIWQHSTLDAAMMESLRAYWVAQLAAAPRLLMLPTDHPRPPIQTNQGDMYMFTVPREQVQSLENLVHKEKATIFMAFVAIFDILLSYYAKSEDIILGTDVAGRNQPETEQLVGFFINQLVLYTKLAGNPDFFELLRRVREVTLGAYAHQEFPFEKLVEALKPERNLQHAPLFQVKIVLQNVPPTVWALSGLTVSTLDFNTGAAQLDLLLDIFEMQEQFLFIFEYSTELFENATIVRMADHLQMLLRAILEQPAIHLDELKALLQREDEQSRSKTLSIRQEAERQRLQSVKRRSISISRMKEATHDD